MKVLAAAVVTALALSAGAGATGPSRNGLIAFQRCCGISGSGLYVIAPDGTKQHRLFQPRGDDAALGPAWSPDGTQIAFTPGGPLGGLWVMQANGAKPHRITIGKGQAGTRAGRGTERGSCSRTAAPGRVTSTSTSFVATGAVWSA